MTLAARTHAGIKGTPAKESRVKWTRVKWTRVKWTHVTGPRDADRCASITL